MVARADSQLERAVPTIDCHSDVMLDVWRRRAMGERSVLVEHHLPAYRAGGLVASVCPVGADTVSHLPYGTDNAYRSTIANLGALRAEADESDGQISIVSSSTELVANLESGVYSIIPSLEGATPFEGDLAKVEELYELGVRVVGLTWNSRNAFAVGLDSGDGGLTELGETGIGLMNDLGIVIDLSHSSDTTFSDVARLSRAPLFASHSNSRSVWNHPRNLTDEQVEAVRASHGAVGVVFCPTFIGPNPVVMEDLYPHIRHLHQLLGDEGLVIGPDYCDYAVEQMLTDVRAHEGSIYDESTLNYPEGIKTAATLQDLIRAMADLGFGARALQQVGFGNFLRVLRDTESARAAA